MKYKIYMETTRGKELIAGWWSGEGFNITTDTKNTHLIGNKEFAEQIANSLSGRKNFLSEVINIKTKVWED